MPFRQPPGVGPTWPVMDTGLQQATPATPLRGEGARAPRLTTSALATDAAGSPASRGRPASAVVNSKRGTAPARSRRNSKEAPKRRSSKKTRGNRGRRGARSTSREFRPASSDAALASAATKRASESAPRLNVGRPKVVKRLNRSQRARLQRHKTAGVRAFGKNIVETSDAPPGMWKHSYRQCPWRMALLTCSRCSRWRLQPSGQGSRDGFCFGHHRPRCTFRKARGVHHPHVDLLVLGTPQPSGKSGKLALARVKKPKLREPPEFMREEERIKQLEANQKRWDKYLLDCLVAETRAVRVPPMPCDL